MAVPQVSAVMAARNAEPFIGAAIASVLEQSWSDFELLVVDDGSTDATAEVVRAIADPRVRLLSTGGVGRGAARNLALDHARGEFLAVVDADDICLPQRFEVQVAVLQARPELAVLGAQMWDFGDWGGPCPGYLMPIGESAIYARLADGQMPIAHAVCMMRRRAVAAVDGYAAECLRCQDLELMLRLRQAGARMDNLPDVLLHYRTRTRHPTWSYWRDNARYRRFAVARAGAVAAALPPPTYAEFAATEFWCSSVGTGIERLRHAGERARRRLKPAGVQL